ncbi:MULTISPECIES: hypothetical protein [Aphanothece]|uniref:hypothetical protein n=1 Tax=Aphanothece TaxID=1121 RepID=UPI00398F0E67
MTLEQRMEAMQLQVEHRLAEQVEQAEPDSETLASLDNVERLLHDCRCLLALDGSEDGTFVQPPLQPKLGSIPTEEFGAEAMASEEVQADWAQVDRMVDAPNAADLEGRDLESVTEPFSQAA